MVKVEYVACIMCGKTVSRNRFKPEPFAISPLEYRVLQVREQVGGRKKQGFFNIDTEARTIVDLWKGSEADRNLAEALKERLLTVLKEYIKAGIIKRSELRLPREKASS